MRARLLPPRRRLIVYAGVLIVVAVAAILLDVRSFLESRSFYFPVRERLTAPPGAEDVAITTPDGLTLHGWFIPATPREGDDPPPAILHVHGNAGNINHHLEFSHFLTRRGISVLIFDYRGYGQSDLPNRALQRDDLLIDTLAAFDALRSRPDVDPDRLGIYGVSLGGVLGLAAAAERPEARAVVSIAAFASWRGIAAQHGTSLGRLAIKSGLDATTSIARMAPPREQTLLLVHGEEDTIVPIRHSVQLRAKAEEAGIPVELIRSDAGHNDIVIETPELQEQIADFLNAGLAGRSR